MKRLVIVFLILIPLLTSCGVQISESPPIPTPIEPVSVFHFSGATSKTSDVFYINKEHWYIEWECEPDSFSHEYSVGIYFGVTIYPVEESIMNPSILAVNTTNSGCDRTYIHNRSGQFYIVVDSLYVESWAIEVYE